VPPSLPFPPPPPPDSVADEHASRSSTG
jgi:hypothetical protein